MKYAAFFLASILCFHASCLGNPVELNKSWLWIYKYEAKIEARSSVSKEDLSTWTVTGNLSVYNTQKYVVLKLDDVKTSLYNGNRSNLKNAEEKDIPPESNVFLQPFYLKKDGENMFIYFEPNEPLWSKNFKRGIASNMDVDIAKLAESKANQIFKEKSVHGYCDVSYKIEETEDKKVYQKIINHDECSELPERKFRNLRGEASNAKDHRHQHAKTVKTATFLSNPKGVFIPYTMESSSNIVVKFMPNAKNTQHLDQYQKYDLIDQSEVETEPDVSKLTEKYDLLYETSEDPTSGRHIYETDTAKLIQQFIQKYNKFNERYVKSPAKNVDISNNYQIEEMFYDLLFLKAEGFEALEEEFMKNEEFRNMFGLYYSMLPYVGTDEFVKYLVKNINEDKLRSNEISMGRLLSIFPSFLQTPSEKILEDLEVLLDLQPTRQRSGKNSGVISFANAVMKINKQISLPQEKLDKYIKLYHNKFLTSEDYEQRMTYLLGLVNMADILDFDLINGIITNDTESEHIRTLAITGFKNKLATDSSKVDKLYNIYWSIVQNKRQTFEVRVTSLDLLLSLKLSDEQFNTIIKKYSLHFNDPQERHLANYLLTSLHSLQNITAYQDNLGPKALEAIRNNQIPFFPKTFVTGNYRLSHTGEDFGSLLETQIISDPSTNAFDLIKVSYNSYGYSFDLGTYTVYIKMDGFIDSIYADVFMRSLKESSVPELVNMLKDNSFVLDEIKRDIHIDIVIFCDNVAVYAAHHGKYEKDELKQFAEDVEQYLITPLYVQYPLVDYKHIPSDLGTPLQFSNFEEDITYHDQDDHLFHYKYTSSYQSWIEAYNPLVDTNIASYKYIGYDTFANINYTVQTQKYTLTWLNKNDSVAMYWDNIVGTSVEDEDILQNYCKECKSYIDYELEYEGKETTKYEFFGFDVDIGMESDVDYGLKRNSLGEFVNLTYSTNDDATVLAAPFLTISHYLSYKQLFSNDLTKGHYKFVPHLDEDTESSIAINFDGNAKKLFKPMTKKEIQFEIDIKHKTLKSEKPEISLKVDYELMWDTDPKLTKGEDIDNKIKFLGLRQMYNITSIPRNNTLATRTCVKRDVLIPFTQGDKYSLEYVSPAHGKTTTKITTLEDMDCEKPERNISLDETFSSSLKSDKLKNKQDKKDYEECVENSKDLKFTSPSSACRRISHKLSEYDQYKAMLRVQIYEENNKKSDIEVPSPIFEYTRENDYIKFAFYKALGMLMNDVDPHYNKTIYHPQTVISPNLLGYGEHTYGLPFLSQSTCTITPSTVEQFSGKFVPNQHDKCLAFAECFHNSTKGLNARTIDNHIEFLFYSKNNILNVEFKDGKVEMQLNGEELHQTFDPKDGDFRVIFVDQNVFYIIDDQYFIYYNTEYLQIRVNSLHSKLLCGVCTFE